MDSSAGLDDKGKEEQPSETFLECNICLEILTKTDAIQPCECPFIRAHVECLPTYPYECARCGYIYAWLAARPFSRCMASTRRHVQCSRARLPGDALYCFFHHNQHRRGVPSMIYLS